MVSCAAFMKVSLIVMNVIIFLMGVWTLMVSLSVWWYLTYTSDLLSDIMFDASLLVVVTIGAGMVVLSLLGCGGAIMEVKRMLLTYYILMFILFVVTVIAGILQLVFREKIVSSLDRELYASIPYYGIKPEFTGAWDDTQTVLQCCGVKSYKDWNDNVPVSCCKSIGGRDRYDRYLGKRFDCKASPNPTTMYMEGCLTKVLEVLRVTSLAIGACALGSAINMLLALAFASGLLITIE